MRRWVRKSTAIAAGLCLGWWAAGLVAAGLGTTQSPTARQERAGEHGDAGAAAAQRLAPSGDQAPFMGPAVWMGAGLFVAAIVLGVPALKLRGPEPPEPAAAPHDH